MHEFEDIILAGSDCLFGRISESRAKQRSTGEGAMRSLKASAHSRKRSGGRSRFFAPPSFQRRSRSFSPISLQACLFAFRTDAQLRRDASPRRKPVGKITAVLPKTSHGTSPQAARCDGIFSNSSRKERSASQRS